MPQSKSSFARQARKTARDERAIQARIDRKDRSRPKQAKSKSPMQVGQREYPASFPEQHLKKPGLESELKPAPMYEAPAYKGSEKLKDWVALVTGGDSGIAAPSPCSMPGKAPTSLSPISTSTKTRR
jgi:hypothetical protein